MFPQGPKNWSPSAPGPKIDPRALGVPWGGGGGLGPGGGGLFWQRLCCLLCVPGNRASSVNVGWEMAYVQFHSASRNSGLVRVAGPPWAIQGHHGPPGVPRGTQKSRFLKHAFFKVPRGTLGYPGGPRGSLGDPGGPRGGFVEKQKRWREAEDRSKKFDISCKNTFFRIFLCIFAKTGFWAIFGGQKTSMSM